MEVKNMTYQYTLQDAMSSLSEDILLLRLCLQGLMEEAKGHHLQELYCLWRLSDYLEQHLGEIESLLQ